MLDDLESRKIKIPVFLYSSKQVVLKESNEPFKKKIMNRKQSLVSN